jgi:hypothetical protein
MMNRHQCKTLLMAAANSLLLLHLSQSAPAQEPSTSPARQAPSVLAPIIQDDLLEITIRDYPPGATMLMRERVDPKGRIGMTMTGQIDVAGLALDDAAKRIKEVFLRKGLLRDASIRIVRTESGEMPTAHSGSAEPGDFYRICIYDAKRGEHSTTSVIQVGTDGMASISIFPKPVQIKVAGLGEYEIEQALVTTFRTERLLGQADLWVVRISPSEARASQKDP